MKSQGTYGATSYDTHRSTLGTTRTVSNGRGQIRIRKSSSRRLRDLPELDLRTPSGRLLPY